MLFKNYKEKVERDRYATTKPEAFAMGSHNAIACIKLRRKEMVLMLARHKVENASTFIKGYNSTELASVRQNAGVKNDATYATVQDENDVLVVHYFDSVEQSEAFLAKPELAEAMASLGVIEEPKIQIFNPL